MIFYTDFRVSMWWENILKFHKFILQCSVLWAKALVTLRFGGFSFCLAITAEGKANQGISGG